ncbi:MAG: lytic murein transglycosylase [Pseudomonadota bacterium]
MAAAPALALSCCIPAVAQSARKSQPAARASAIPDWIDPRHLQSFWEELHAQHSLSEPWLARQFSGLVRQDRALQLVNPEPSAIQERPKPSLSRALTRNLDARTQQEGRALLVKEQLFLARAEDLYGVPPEVIVGILGVETRYGRIRGSFPTLDTLTSLAFLSPRRQDFFRRELGHLLVMGHQGTLDLSKTQGSFAGALGIPQFMPSSWQSWAVDFDQDGRPDLIESMPDAMGSVGHFLQEHGWQRGIPAFFSLGSTLPVDPSAFLVQGLEAKHTFGEIARVGLVSKDIELPAQTPASIISLPEPDQSPVYWLVTPNFFAVTKYNRSYLYAASVLSLAQAIR